MDRQTARLEKAALWTFLKRVKLYSLYFEVNVNEVTCYYCDHHHYQCCYRNDTEMTFRAYFYLLSRLALIQLSNPDHALCSCCAGWTIGTCPVFHQCPFLCLKITLAAPHDVTWPLTNMVPHSSWVLCRKLWHLEYESFQVVSQYHSCLIRGRWVYGKPQHLLRLQCLLLLCLWVYSIQHVYSYCHIFCKCLFRFLNGKWLIKV